MVVSAVILAGGQSRRMGTDKAFIKVNGTPLVVRTASMLRDAGIQYIHTVGRQPGLAALEIPTIVETNEGHHPLFGVATALDRLPDEHVLFVPCDLVNLGSNHIRALLEYGSPCVAICTDIPHPLFSILPKTMAQTALDLGKSGRPARCLIDGLPTIQLPNPVLIDANHREQVPR